MKPFGGVLILLLLASCGADEPVGKPDPIVVYAPGDASSKFATLLAEFTEETNVPVSIKWGSSAENTNAVIEKTGIPADILITDNVADIWRAADEGALRPIESDAFDDVSDLVKDRDGYWVSVNVYPAMLMSQKSNAQAPTFVQCFMTSDHPLSRSLIANLIQTKGLRDAERSVRRDIRALDIEPFATQAELVDAIRSGECDVGLVANVTTDDLSLIPAAAYDAALVDAVGVGRHSRYPDSAQLFVDWLIRERPIDVPDSLVIPVSIAGYRDEEARLLAERAGYR